MAAYLARGSDARPHAARTARLSALGAVLLAMTVAAAQGQPASLVADIAQGSPLSSGFLDFFPIPSPTVTIGDRAYFFADDQIHGKELWVTDGTTAGSHLVVDLCPGSCSAVGPGLTSWGGNLYFWAVDGDHASAAPWRSDGTAAGTVRLADVQLARVPFVGLGSQVYFVADDGAHGAEIWRTDGTPAGTELFVDLHPGVETSAAALLTASATQLFFAADDGSIGNVLWRTDGSVAGTVQIPAIVPTTFAFRCALLPGGDLVIASYPHLGNDQIWRTDGTVAGTSMLTDFGSLSHSLKAFQPFSGSIYFSRGGELWRTDGTPIGTTLVTAIPGGGTFTSEAMVSAGGVLYFGATTSAFGNELWKSDGSAAGTGIVKDLIPGAGNGFVNDSSILTYGGSLGTPLPAGGLFFYATDGVHGFEPWATDGTEPGTTLLGDLAPGTANSVDTNSTPGILGDRILFRSFNFPAPSQLWQSDGTPAGTAAIVQPNTQVSSVAWPFLSPFAGTPHGALFAADDHTHGIQPWLIDSTGATAQLLGDLAPFAGPTILGQALGHVFFSAGTLSPGPSTELLSTDGATTEILLTRSDGSFGPPLVFGGSIYFTSTDASETSLWRTDGTLAGLTLLRSWSGGQYASLHATPAHLWIWVGRSGSSVEDLYVSQGLPGDPTFVASATDLRCRQLRGDDSWILVRKLGAYGSGTSSVELLSAGPVLTTAASFLREILECRSLGDRLALFADDGSHGVEPWITDGTVAGTALLGDIAPGSTSSITSDSAILENAGRLFILADDGVHGSEIWTSDGSPMSAALLADIRPGSAGIDMRNFTVSGNRVFFNADDGTHGRELWTTDGTPAATHLVADVVAGPTSSVPQDARGFDGLLLFSATDGTHGRELFASDGSPAGTRLVQDIAPGAESSSPINFAAIGPNVYFYADDATHGFEPWKLPRRALANAVPAALGYYTTTPCRLLDTRDSTPLVAGAPLTFAVVGQCGIPASAQAIAVNVTTLAATQSGSVAVYPGDDAGPGPDLVPVAAGRTRATNTVLRISLDDVGSLTALAQLPSGEQMQLILDVSGYFAP